MDITSSIDYLPTNSTEIKFQQPSNAKIILEIYTAEKELVYSCESTNFANLRDKSDSPYHKNPTKANAYVSIASPENPGAYMENERLTDSEAMLPLHLLGFAPGHKLLKLNDIKKYIAVPGNFGCYYKIDMKKLKSFKITSVSSKLEWTEVIRE